MFMIFVVDLIDYDITWSDKLSCPAFSKCMKLLSDSM